MKTSKIVDALHYIDEDLVAEAITYRSKEEDIADGIITISEANGKEIIMKKKGRVAKRTLLVAALIAVLVLGTLTVAVAAFRGSLSEGLKNLFHISAEQEEELLGREDGLIYIVDTEEMDTTAIGERESNQDSSQEESRQVLSDTHQGITVSLKETMIDACYANIVLRVDGIPKELEDQLDVLNLELWVAGESLHSGGAKEFVMENGSREIVIYQNMANNRQPGWHLGQEIELIWEDMELYLGDGKRQMIAEDTWKLKWTLEGSDQTMSLQMNAPLGETGAILREITISPISVYVVYDFERKTESFITKEGNVGNEVKAPPLPQGVILKDGTEYSSAISGGSEGHYGDQTEQYMVVRKWRYLMDPDEIESVIFLDEKTRETYIVPLSQGVEKGQE